MIELQKVKRDIINYGALKVYTTFLTLSEDEVDPELFASSQLKEIFEKRFDVIKVDMSFVEGEEATVVAKELLIFKLSKCSDEEVSYMSNVNDEGKLSSLVLTKSGDEVSLEVVEYSVGSGSSEGLELIEWDGDRNFTEEEVAKLLTGKVGVKMDTTDTYPQIYLPCEIHIDVEEERSSYALLSQLYVYDDVQGNSYNAIHINANGEWDTFSNLFEDLKGTKLYKHTLTDASHNVFDSDEFISPYPNPLTSYDRWNQCKNDYGLPTYKQINENTHFWNFVVATENLMVTTLKLTDSGSINVITDEEVILYSTITDTVTPL